MITAACKCRRRLCAIMTSLVAFSSASSCGTERRALSADNAIRLEAISEVAVLGKKAHVCVAVAHTGLDERTTAPRNAVADPTGDLAHSLARLKGVYPQSRCKALSGPSSPLHVVIYPIEWLPRSRRATVDIYLRQESAVDEMRRLVFSSVGERWELESNTVVFQP
jgi:hypothetical protein